jgi:hypothetical protein
MNNVGNISGKTMITRHAANIVSETNRTMSDKPVAAMQNLCRLQGYVTGMIESLKINDKEWIDAMMHGLDSEILKYSRQITIQHP